MQKKIKKNGQGVFKLSQKVVNKKEFVAGRETMEKVANVHTDFLFKSMKAVLN